MTYGWGALEEKPRFVELPGASAKAERPRHPQPSRVRLDAPFTVSEFDGYCLYSFMNIHRKVRLNAPYCSQPDEQ